MPEGIFVRVMWREDTGKVFFSPVDAISEGVWGCDDGLSVAVWASLLCRGEEVSPNFGDDVELYWVWGFVTEEVEFGESVLNVVGAEVSDSRDSFVSTLAVEMAGSARASDGRGVGIDRG